MICSLQRLKRKRINRANKMATLLYENTSNNYKSLVYFIQGANQRYVLRFDISLTKGKDTRVMLLGTDKRWILMMEDKFYEREDNTPNKVQQEKILLGEITKEIAELQNQQIKEARRSEKLQYYFTSLDKIM
jgi:hypothetical protein